MNGGSRQTVSELVEQVSGNMYWNGLFDIESHRYILKNQRYINNNKI